MTAILAPSTARSSGTGTPMASSTRSGETATGASGSGGKPATGAIDGIDIDRKTAGAGTLYVQESYVRAADEASPARVAREAAGTKGSKSKTNRSLSRGGRIGRSKAKDSKEDFKRAVASSASTSRSRNSPSRGRRRAREWEEWPPPWETACLVRHRFTAVTPCSGWSSSSPRSQDTEL